MQSTGVIVDVRPNPALVDQPLAISVRGVRPGANVTLRTEMDGRGGTRWRSHAAYEADPSGVVDVRRHAPNDGSYAGVDPMGLFWSMVADDESPAFIPPAGASVPALIEVTVDGRSAAAIRVERRRWAPGLRRVELREAGMVGTLFAPQGAPAPPVLVLGGSGGRLESETAALLASHGMPALALGYFGLDGLPPRMCEIPLEYFERAMAWLIRQEAVRGSRVLLYGVSRGGELALLLGATFRNVAGVVAVVPSGLVHRGPGCQPETSAWSHRGRPLPYASRTDPASRERAAIPVERIDGPVLLLSAADDRVWPSAELAGHAARRLEERGHSHSHEHITYADAGHGIRPPYRPIPTGAFGHAISGNLYEVGGTRAGNAFAAADSWMRTVGLLRSAIQRPR